MVENLPGTSKVMDSMSNTKERVGRRIKFLMTKALIPLDFETQHVN